jgi:hypothetical protein
MTNNSAFTRGLIALGYRDYIASRFLINNEYFVQGMMLASSAVEKYLKAVLSVYNIRCKVHLNELDKIKTAFAKTEYSILFDKLDPVFLKLLGKSYKYRYYDEGTVTEADTIGFLVNQFLGELDYTIALCEKIFIITDENNNPLDTQYKREAKECKPGLFLNNYILNNIPKKEFMNRKSNAFGLHLNPKFLGTEIEIKGTDVAGEYTNCIWEIHVTNK